MKQKIMVILIILAVGLAVAIIVKQNPFERQGNSNNTNQVGITDAEKIENILEAPKEGATQDDKRKHAELAASMAIKTSEIEIFNCAPDPIVTSLKLGQTFVVRNTGTQPMKFGFNTLVELGPGKEVEFKADFKEGVGIYGYDCNGPKPSKPIGFILVTP